MTDKEMIEYLNEINDCMVDIYKQLENIAKKYHISDNDMEFDDIMTDIFSVGQSCCDKIFDIKVNK